LCSFIRSAIFTAIGWSWKRFASANVRAISAGGTPWSTMMKNPIPASASRTAAAVASSAPVAPARYGPTSITGIAVSLGRSPRARTAIALIVSEHTTPARVAAAEWTDGGSRRSMRDGGERAMKITRGHDRRSAHRDAGSTMRHRLMKGHAGAPDRSRGVLIWVIFAVSALLPGLAPASPPDPLWISGVYDDADG